MRKRNDRKKQRKEQQLMGYEDQRERTARTFASKVNNDQVSIYTGVSKKKNSLLHLWTYSPHTSPKSSISLDFYSEENAARVCDRVNLDRSRNKKNISACIKNCT